MQTPTLSLDSRKLSRPAQEMYKSMLSTARDKVIAGQMTPEAFQSCQADALRFLGKIFGKRGMWA
jgi:hypothetical protein